MNGNSIFFEGRYTPYYNIIINIAQSVGCENFLELGLANGVNHMFMRNFIPNCVGVDMSKGFEGDIPRFYQMTTDEFFKQNTEKFDIIFIDACHKFDQVKIDFENSLKCLEDRGIIIFHDTDPFDAHMLDDSFSSDSYKIANYVRKEHPELDFITLPVSSMGLSMCNRRDDARHLKFTKLTFNI
jgi:hypothetical protein